MRWRDVKSFLWSHELLYAFLIFLTLVVIYLLFRFSVVG